MGPTSGLAFDFASLIIPLYLGLFMQNSVPTANYELSIFPL